MSIEGIPDGWELVRIGTPKQDDWLMDEWTGKPVLALNTWPTCIRVIIRKIDKPKQYRPFANAAEFEPHRDRWIRRTYNGDLSCKRCFKGHAYDDKGIYDLGAHFTYQELFDDGRQFDDGTPFGIEVTE